MISELKEYLLRSKKLIFNFSVKSVFTLITKFISLITFPLILRALGPSSYGTLNLILIIIQYATLPIGLFGLNTYGVREIVNNEHYENIVNKIISTQLLVAISSVITTLLVVSLALNQGQPFIIALVIAFPMVFAYASNLEFFYVSQKKLIVPTLSNFIGQIVYVAGVVFLVKKAGDLYILLSFTACAPVIANILMYVYYLKSGAGFKFNSNIKTAFLLFKSSYKLGLSANLESFYSTIPMIILPVLTNNYYLGLYAAGYKIFAIFVIFYVAFFMSLAPYLVQLKNSVAAKKKKVILLLASALLIAGIICGVILYFLNDKILLFILGKDFIESIVIFKTIAVTLIPIYPVYMFIGNLLVYFGNEKYYLTSLIVAIISLLILSPFLVSKFYALGCVYAMAVSLLAAISISGFFLYRTEFYKK